MTWAPPAGWQNFTDLAPIVGWGGQVNLNNSTDYKLVGYNGGGLRLNGGRNIVIMGSVFTVNTAWLPGGDNCGLCIGDNGTTVSGRIVHVEGSKFTGSVLGDGMQIFDPNAIVQVENDHDTLSHGADGPGVHGDIIQPWGGVKELRIDGYTGYTTCQGGMFKSDVSTPNGPIRLRRANFRDTAGQCGFISWVSSSGNTNLYTDGTNGFYVDGYASRPWPSQVLWPQNASTGTDADGTYAYYPSLNGSGSSGQMWRKWDGSANGQIRKGVPPLGDFVPTGSVGVGYVSPGYQ